MDNCLFCKIIKGEIPSYKVYEDENFFAFLDIQPRSKGHALLIPKEHYRWVYDVPNFGQYWETAREVGKKVQEEVGAEWINFFTHGEVPHAHIHILPRTEDINKAPTVPNFVSISKEELQELAKKVSASFNL